MDITQLLKDLGIFSIVIAAIAWLLRSIGNHLIDKRLVSFKTELDRISSEHQQKLDFELESHRKQLQIDYLKHSRVHEKRLEVMSEIYSRLVQLDQSIKELTAFLKPSTGEKYKDRRKREMSEAAESYQRFKIYFDKKRIMLTGETCQLIDELVEKYSESLRLSTFKDRYNVDSQYALKISDEASDIVEKQIPKIKNNLETEFGTQLGTIEA
ncbi:hypothetical protein NC796_04825 [Aliifodinibius sp. S!AR15-10]|uniref:hypothetical protein n=1 Tax=Aliifodinibius sp. S!AR15-10 TaxID=2950437 RepID=UPI002865D929|nr:hypothetical protein [Aliifodinibius sp. S!AR15-10]MDR8390454.1 hypothetical protein [Aliifodinibius sp. S!AR15-10]